jgi:hypothetical protein
VIRVALGLLTGWIATVVVVVYALPWADDYYTTNGQLRARLDAQNACIENWANNMAALSDQMTDAGRCEFYLSNRLSCKYSWALDR